MPPLLQLLLGLGIPAGFAIYDSVGKTIRGREERFQKTLTAPPPEIDNTAQLMKAAQAQSGLLSILEGAKAPVARQPNVEEAMNRAAVRQIMGEENLMRASQAAQSAMPLLAALSAAR